MRCSLVHDGYVFIGTEEKILYMIETENFNILDKLET